MEPGKSPSDSEMHMPWRTIALAASGTAICVSVGALGALVIVASIHGADGLSTVALALAILAFTSQIIVFVTQVFASNRQTARQDEIYAQMNGLLQGLKGTTDATQATMERHMTVLLQAAVGEAAEVAGGSPGPEEDEEGVPQKFNPLQFEQRVLDRAREVAAEAKDPLFDMQPSPPPQTPHDKKRIDELQRYPEQSPEAEEAVENLKRLSPWAVRVLARFGEDELSSLKGGISPGIQKDRTAPITSELVASGLVELDEGSERVAQARLTPQGKNVARLIVPRGRPPEWIASQLKKN